MCLLHSAASYLQAGARFGPSVARACRQGLGRRCRKSYASEIKIATTKFGNRLFELPMINPFDPRETGVWNEQIAAFAGSHSRP